MNVLYRLVFGFRSQFGLWEPLENHQRQLPATSCQMGPDGGLNARFLAGFPLASDLCREQQLAPASGSWGKHAFRVGGLNALQDAGASSVEILALGRWNSDAWRVYSRRHRAAMVKWTAAVLQPRSR